MNRFAIIPLLLIAALACRQSGPKQAIPSEVAPKADTGASEVNTLTDQERSEGWISLFDGKSKAGWHIWHGKSEGSAWKVEDGALHLDPREMKEWQTVGGGDIVTDFAFSNFHFSVEWKVADSGNSGIIYLVQEDPVYEHTWHTGPEMQVLDNNGHPDAKITKHRAGDLYDLVSVSRETVKKAGEWNKAEVMFNNGALDLFLNGEKVVSTRLDDENWKKMKAASKFSDKPGFGAFKSGHIALQDHGNKVWFRNIRIRPL